MPTASKGFTKVPNALLRRDELPMETRFLAVLLLMFAWQDDTTFPSQATLASLLGRDVRTVQRLLQRLEAAGLIRTLRRAGRNGTNAYDVTGLRSLLDGGSHDTHVASQTTPMSHNEDGGGQDPKKIEIVTLSVTDTASGSGSSDSVPQGQHQRGEEHSGATAAAIQDNDHTTLVSHPERARHADAVSELAVLEAMKSFDLFGDWSGVDDPTVIAKAELRLPGRRAA